MKLSLIVVNPVYTAKVSDVNFPFVDPDVIWLDISMDSVNRVDLSYPVKNLQSNVSKDIFLFHSLFYQFIDVLAH